MALTLLVVDDDRDVREALVWMMEDAGHHVLEASRGHEALDLLARCGSVDLVVSDINMPMMDGVELARRIGVEHPSVPVLLISGRPRQSTARPFLPKPFRWEVLAEAIETLALPQA